MTRYVLTRENDAARAAGAASTLEEIRLLPRVRILDHTGDLVILLEADPDVINSHRKVLRGLPVAYHLRRLRVRRIYNATDDQRLAGVAVLEEQRDLASDHVRGQFAQAARGLCRLDGIAWKDDKRALVAKAQQSTNHNAVDPIDDRFHGCPHFLSGFRALDNHVSRLDVDLPRPFQRVLAA